MYIYSAININIFIKILTTYRRYRNNNLCRKTRCVFRDLVEWLWTNPCL